MQDSERTYRQDIYMICRNSEIPIGRISIWYAKIQKEPIGMISIWECKIPIDMVSIYENVEILRDMVSIWECKIPIDMVFIWECRNS